MRRYSASLLVPLVLSLLAARGVAQDPGGARWIWLGDPSVPNRPDGERVWFRARVRLAGPARAARLAFTADNHLVLRVNGREVARGDDWSRIGRRDVARELVAGENLIEAECRNDGGPAGFILFGDLEVDGGPRVRLETGPAWRASAKEPAGVTEDGWQDPVDRGAATAAPWNLRSWSDRQDFSPLPGFSVEKLASGFGSLIALTAGEDRRLFAATEGGGVFEIRDADGDGNWEGITPFAPTLVACQGLLWRAGGLYAMGRGAEGLGLYRVEDDDRDHPRLLARFEGGGEHGPHAIIAGPDGRLYIAVGNHSRLLGEVAEDRGRLVYEGHVLPRDLDPTGHARDVVAPGGVVLTCRPDGTDWRVFAQGFRNPYDLAFSASGELFTYDADMEWDIGLPWYRPCRLYHVVPGGEYGWRTGSSKWPETFPDALPAAVDAGRGSPTGLLTYDGAQFPARFRGALLGADWSQGRILAFHLEPRGAGFGGSYDVLLSGRPLNVTDLALDSDGSLLFTTGGRGTAGGLWRLSYEGPPEAVAVGGAKSPVASRVTFANGAAARTALGADDRTVRYLAARHLERAADSDLALPPDEPGNELVRSELLLIRARAVLVGRMPVSGFPWGAVASLVAAPDLAVRRNALRALQLVLVEPAVLPPDDLGPLLVAALTRADRALDRELMTLVARIDPPGGVEELFARLIGSSSRLDQIHAASCLRATRRTWPSEMRRAVVRWCALAERWPGGVSYRGYLTLIRRDAEARLDDADRAALADVFAPDTSAAAPLATGDERDPDRLLDFLRNTRGAARRDAAEGARLFQRSCAMCHAFGGQGSGLGPDLTTVAARLSLPDLLVAMTDPSRAVSDQYRAVIAFTADGDQFTGLPVLDDAKTLVLMQSSGETVTIPTARIEERRFSAFSGMPAGLLGAMTQEEIADLVRYLLDGRAEEPASASPWRPLFAGPDLAGWRGVAGLWRIDGDEVVGDAVGLAQNTFLVSEATYADFIIEMEVAVEAGNSGLQFRSQATEDHRMTGYQADMGETWWGSLYEEGGRGVLVQAPRELWGPSLEPTGWNHYLVEARGTRIRIEVNGVPTLVFEDDRARSGQLGFQLHAGGHTRVRLRNVRLREL